MIVGVHISHTGLKRFVLWWLGKLAVPWHGSYVQRDRTSSGCGGDMPRYNLSWREMGISLEGAAPTTHQSAPLIYFTRSDAYSSMVT